MYLMNKKRGQRYAVCNEAYKLQTFFSLNISNVII